MAKVKYFNGETELHRLTSISNKDFAAKFPGVVGKRCDSFSMWVGEPIDFKSVWIDGAFTHDYRPIERTITFKSNPSLHKCDARCYNATGRVMNCECSCMGRNHGAGRFNCSAVS